MLLHLLCLLFFKLCFSTICISNVQFTLQAQKTVFKPLRKKPFENTVGKGENAGNQHFLLLPVFSTLPKTNFYFLVTFLWSSANAVQFTLQAQYTVFKQTSIFLFGVGVTSGYSTSLHCHFLK